MSGTPAGYLILASFLTLVAATVVTGVVNLATLVAGVLEALGRVAS